MKSVKVWLLMSVLVWLPLAGCGGYHGMGGHGRSGMGMVGEKAQKEMAALIDQTVQDPDKAKRAQAVVGDMIEEITQSYQNQRQFHRQLYEMNANYDATPEDFTKILDEASNSRMRSATKILGLRFKLKEMLTAAEWKTLSEGMNRYQSRYGQGHDRPEGQRSY